VYALRRYLCAVDRISRDFSFGRVSCVRFSGPFRIIFVSTFRYAIYHFYNDAGISFAHYVRQPVRFPLERMTFGRFRRASVANRRVQWTHSSNGGHLKRDKNCDPPRWLCRRFGRGQFSLNGSVRDESLYCSRTTCVNKNFRIPSAPVRSSYPIRFCLFFDPVLFARRFPYSTYLFLYII